VSYGTPITPSRFMPFDEPPWFPTLSPELAALVWAQAQRPVRPTLEATGTGYRHESPPPIRPQYAFTDIAFARSQAEIANALIEAYCERPWEWERP
jgi:hypothetical protein